MATEFKLPELGENIEKGKVTNVMVQVGDMIAKDQPVIEIETDKASVEVPCEVAGKVAEIRARAGEDLRVGAVILVLEAADAPAEPLVQETTKKPAPPKKAETARKQAPKEEAPAVQQLEMAPQEIDEEVESPSEAAATPVPSAETPEPQASAQGRGSAPAAPSVRRLAREIGINIHQVPGSGPGGRISEEDVKSFSRRVNTDAGGAAPVRLASSAPAASSTTPPLPDFERWGAIERREMSGVRRRTAENMAYAWSTVPQVTQFDRADVTDIEALRKQYAKRAEAASGKLTMTAILVKIIAAALKKFPQFNASIDMANNEIIYKRYIHIGVAVDTDRGLLVPVIRDCDTKSVMQIAAELGELAERARTKKTTLDEMQGGTFTISNLGGIGGTAFTPIVYSPQVAILGVSRGQTEPVWRDGQFVPRMMLPLSLSYDHRVIDGADGARFLRWVCQALEQPFLLFLESD